MMLVLTFATLASGQGPNRLRTRRESIGLHLFTEENRRHYFRESSDFLDLRRWHGTIYYPLSVELLQGFPAKVALSQEASHALSQMRIAVPLFLCGFTAADDKTAFPPHSYQQGRV